MLAAERAQAKAAAAAAAVTKLEKQLKAQTAVRLVHTWRRAVLAASQVALCGLHSLWCRISRSLLSPTSAQHSQLINDAFV